MTASWHRALGLALTGEALELGVQDAFDVDAAVAALAAAGWDAERVHDHAHQCAGSVPWPHPVAAHERDGVGPAEFHAAILRLRERLGLSALEVRPPSTRTRLDADERRLLADVPPHFGRT